MGFDDPEGARLFRQMRKNPGEENMFEDVGEITGVEIVTIIHMTFAVPSELCFAFQTLRRRRVIARAQFAGAVGSVALGGVICESSVCSGQPFLFSFSCLLSLVS
jgi:hypothetical protein